MPKSGSLGKKAFCSFVYANIEIKSACGVLFKKKCKVMLGVKKRKSFGFLIACDIRLCQTLQPEMFYLKKSLETEGT